MCDLQEHKAMQVNVKILQKVFVKFVDYKLLDRGHLTDGLFVFKNYILKQT